MGCGIPVNVSSWTNDLNFNVWIADDGTVAVIFGTSVTSQRLLQTLNEINKLKPVPHGLLCMEIELRQYKNDSTDGLKKIICFEIAALFRGKSQAHFRMVLILRKLIRDGEVVIM